MFHRNKDHGLLRLVGFVALVAAGVGAFLYWRDQKRKEQEALDWYLLGDSYRNPRGTNQGSTSPLKEDLNSWRILNQENQDVTLSFAVDELETAREFMNDLAQLGISSMLDEGNGIVDVLITGSMDSDDLDEIIETITVTSGHRGAVYQGYLFDY